MAALALERVGKAFGSVQVVHDVSFEVADGEFVVFVDPSGCGKSTLLRMICGLESATNGDIRIGGDRVNDLAASRRGLALVFQSYALYPHMTVHQNMAFGLENLRTPKAEIAARVGEAPDRCTTSRRGTCWCSPAAAAGRAGSCCTRMTASASRGRAPR